MNKNRIRLTESQLHRVIKESVKKMIKEIEVIPPKRDSYLSSINGNTDINSPIPKDWLTDASLYKALNGQVPKLSRNNKPKFNDFGFDIKTGIHKDTGTKKDPNGYNMKGFRKGRDKEGFDFGGRDKEGFDRNGWDKDGYDRNGFNRKGIDREGYNRNGFNSNGFNREGFDKNGKKLGKSTWVSIIEDYLKQQHTIRLCTQYKTTLQGNPSVYDAVISRMKIGKHPSDDALGRALIRICAQKEAKKVLMQYAPNNKDNSRLLSYITNQIAVRLILKFEDAYEIFYS